METISIRSIPRRLGHRTVTKTPFVASSIPSLFDVHRVYKADIRTCESKGTRSLIVKVYLIVNYGQQVCVGTITKKALKAEHSDTHATKQSQFSEFRGDGII